MYMLSNLADKMSLWVVHKKGYRVLPLLVPQVASRFFKIIKVIQLDFCRRSFPISLVLF